MLKLVRDMPLKASAALAAVAMTALPSTAHAQAASGISGTVSRLVQQLLNIPQLLSLIAYIGGAAFLIMGLLRLKAHVENPGQVKLPNALGPIAVGCLLIALPWVAEMIIATFGAGSQGGPAVTRLNYGAP